MNYRELYKDYYGIDFDNYFDVHHIDRNRKNNNINNLLLLPSKLHSQFHFNLNILEKYKITDISRIQTTYEMNEYLLNAVQRQAVTVKQICLWVNFKQNLDNDKNRKIGFQALPLSEKIKKEIKEHISERW